MEAAKPKRKQKKKAKGTASRSAERREESQDSKENAASPVPEAESSKTAETSENASLTEPVAEDSAKCDLPSTSGLSEKHKLAEDTTTRETIVSNKDDAENIPQGLSEQENEQSSHSWKEANADTNERELENLESEETGHVDTSDNLDTVESDSTTSVVQNQSDDGSEVQSNSTKPEISSVAESQAIAESEMQAAQHDELAVSHEAPKGSHKTEEIDTIENSKLHSSEESTVGENVGNFSLQVVTDKTPLVIEGSRTRQMYPDLDSVARESVSSIKKYRMTLEAFSEDHLKTLYFNPLLEQMEGFVEHFIRISKQDDHEFYELVNTYFRGRNALAMAIKEYEIVLAECEKKKEQLWITKDFSVTAQGKCLDQVNVTHNHTYQQVELNPGVPGEIENMLDKLHKALHETLALQRYTCQLARLHIDMYIYDMLHQSSILGSVTTDTLVIELCPVDMSQEVQAEIQKLRDCISVLFMFVRQPIQDEEFVTILNGWMEQLVAVLLRVASLADLVFLLNHMLRCPAGFTSKIAHFIQFPVPQFKVHGYNVVDEPYYWDNPLVHHFVAMLAAVLRPVREREGFLHKLSPGKQAAVRSISWTIVDDDGESLEDEDPETSWMLIQENDLIALFSQFPFDAIFKHLLKMDPNIPNDCLTESHYHVEHTTSRDIMRMLAFASCVVYVMGSAFRSYEKVRYRAFVKRVGRTIRYL